MVIPAGLTRISLSWGTSSFVNFPHSYTPPLPRLLLLLTSLPALGSFSPAHSSIYRDSLRALFLFRLHPSFPFFFEFGSSEFRLTSFRESAFLRGLFSLQVYLQEVHHLFASLLNWFASCVFIGQVLRCCRLVLCCASFPSLLRVNLSPWGCYEDKSITVNSTPLGSCLLLRHRHRPYQYSTSQLLFFLLQQTAHFLSVSSLLPITFP